MRTVTVVGASLAGLNAVEQLRTQGFEGRIVVIGEESHRPYDRPPLTKKFLAGSVAADELRLADEADLTELAADWRLGVRAEHLDTAAGVVTLSDGTEIATDGVVIATGGRARSIPGWDDLVGVHTLRTIEDAIALRTELVEHAQSIVVVGAGWIGAEVASTCRELGLQVTVVEATQAPLAAALGPEMAGVCRGLHADHGVALRCGVGVAAFTSVPHGGRHRVTGVVLEDGTQLHADAVVLGIGMRPATDWLTGSGLGIEDGVLCDSGCVTRAPAVVAVGDVARYQLGSGRTVRHEHWNNAVEQPPVAIRNLLAGTTVESYHASGYVWSDQYGVRLQVAGDTARADHIDVVDGSPDDRKFLATYHRNGELVGALAMNNPKLFGRMRRQLAGRAAGPVGAPVRT